jgi:kynureninase
VKDYSAEFFVPSGTYLLTHSVGCQPKGVEAAVNAHFNRTWQTLGGDAWPAWLEIIEHFRNHLASLFNAKANEFCPQVNLSSALNKIIHGLPKRPSRNIIVLSELDFPSIGFVAKQATRAGYELRFIKKPQDVTDPKVWEAAIGNDVQVVLATHVLSNTGQRLPIADIAQTARKNNAYSVIDVAQSAGVIPIDFNEWHADFVIGSCVKWLCGGPGAGFLWAASAIIKDVEPIDVGWFSHADPFEFDIHEFRYANDASRFMGGTPSVLPFVVANVGLKILSEIGVANIADYNQRLIDELITLLPEKLIQSPTDANTRGGTIIVDLKSASDNDKFSSEFARAKIACDRRSNGFRFSPHIYNTSNDIVTLADFLTRAHTQALSQALS